jgi:hypothetical protein
VQGLGRSAFDEGRGILDCGLEIMDFEWKARLATGNGIRIGRNTIL